MTYKIVIKIDKDVPIPMDGYTSKYPWEAMEIGDSFLFPSGLKPKNCQTQASLARRRYQRKFMARSTPDGVRCWRIA